MTEPYSRATTKSWQSWCGAATGPLATAGRVQAVAGCLWGTSCHLAPRTALRPKRGSPRLW
eukprot:10527059-Alexandrium_andersonii.AAC.2